MAVTGAEPISAENLRAVIDGLGLGREMLFAGFCDEESLNGSLFVPGSIGDFGSFVIEIFVANQCLTFEVSATKGKHQLNDNISVSIASNGDWVSFSFSSYYSNTRICRIFGVRAAG